MHRWPITLRYPIDVLPAVSLASGAEDDPRDPVGSSAVQAFGDVAIYIERDRHVCVTEAFLHDLRVLAGGQCERRPRVPQVVQPDAWQAARSASIWNVLANRSGCSGPPSGLAYQVVVSEASAHQ